MKNILMPLLLFAGNFVFAQETITEPTTKTYRYGYNGMDLIATTPKETIIVSTFNSKLSLKEDIAQRIFQYYWENLRKCSPEPHTLTIEGQNARVTGKCLVFKKGNLTTIEFHYEKVEWADGKTELYRNTFD
ncbi:MAG: hypothetical protein RL607_387 [Bacteroidota bacterium]|jgi:hypothetical protein